MGEPPFLPWLPPIMSGPSVHSLPGPSREGHRALGLQHDASVGAVTPERLGSAAPRTPKRIGGSRGRARSPHAREWEHPGRDGIAGGTAPCSEPLR